MFRMTRECKEYFEKLTDEGKANKGKKLSIQFDGYYLCLLVGLYQVKLDATAVYDGTLLEYYPGDYPESCEYLAGLLIAAEIKRIPVDKENPDEVEKLMSKLIDARSKALLSELGYKRMNQYAARGFEVVREKLTGIHTSLEWFYDDYFRCFQNGIFQAE
jgi:hypothetical protein